MAAPRPKPRGNLPAGPVPASQQARLVHPNSAKDLVRILASRQHYPSPIRVVGSASSSTRCTEAPGGTIVDLSEMNRVLRIDHDSVTVQPGITVAELADVLDAKGLELIGGFDFANRSIGGAVAASGLEAIGAGEAGSFVSNVLQIKFVTPDGSKGCVNDATQTMLRLFRLNYGLLGIAYEITLRVRPAKNLNLTTLRIKPGNVDRLMAELTKSQSSARLKLFPFRESVHCELRQLADTEGSGGRLAWRLKSWAANSALPNAALALAKMVPVGRLRYPIVDSIGESTMTLTAIGQANAPSAHADQMTQTNLFGNNPIAHTSWAFPQAGFGGTVAAFFDFCKQHYERTGFRCDPPAVAFPTPRDSSALLSPSFDEPVVTLTAINIPVDGWDDFAFEYAEFAQRRSGIPLFAQSLHATVNSVRRSYDKRWQAFCRTRQQIDPERRLVNSYFESFLS